MTNVSQQMFALAKETESNAYAPYSKYRVSACIQTENGDFFSGCNIENAAYGLTQCAESIAIAQMIAQQGKQTIRRILVTASSATLCTPCGACRQRIREFSSPDTEVILCNNKSVVETVSLDTLLPNAFGPDHFIKESL